jgi:phosphatidate cytidylyltransferase
VVLIILFAPPLALIAVLSSVSALMSSEVFTLFFSKSFPLGRFFCAASSAACGASISLYGTYPDLTLFLFALLPFLCFLPYMFHPSSPSDTASGPILTLGISLYTGALLGFAGLLYSSSQDGAFWLISLLTATFVGDTGAYAFGRLIGGYKLAPRLSPGKTWSGALGGVVSTTAALVACKYLFLSQIPLSWALLFGPILSLACQMGDLAESFLKRGLGVKDSGDLIPGHGGLLDRCDALLFSSPCMYIFFLFLHAK